MADEIGELLETSGEMHVEWRIADFLALPDGVDKCYRSESFFFSHACWRLLIYPNGRSDCPTQERIILYLCRIDWGPSLTMSFSLGLKRADGTEEILLRIEDRSFHNESRCLGTYMFLERSDMRRRESDLVPAGTLTITCKLSCNRLLSTDAFLYRMLWNTSLSFQGMVDSTKGTDVTLRLKDGEIRAHRSILEARSYVFSRMFSADMRESRTGEVDLEDAEKGPFEVALAHVYGGDPEGLSSENVCKVYGIAHKYELEDLKRLCAVYMQECLSVDTVCDVIALADLYKETRLMDRAKEFFVNSATEIVKTDKWKALKRVNPAIVSELLECILVENASKIKI